MKQKSFKQMNRRRRDFSSAHGSSSKKRKLIIGIIIAVVALLLIAALVAAIVINNMINQIDPDGSLGINNGNNVIDNIFGDGGDDDIEEEDKITSVQVVGYPDKRTYYCGDFLDKTGLRVDAFYQSGKYVSVVDECTVTGFDSSVPVEKQTLTVTYGEFTDTFTVTIKEAPKPVAALQSITLESKPKTEYKLGDYFEADGGVILCTYTDGTTKRVNLEPAHIIGFTYAMESGVGTYTITVVYRENGVRVDTTYKITITQ